MVVLWKGIKVGFAFVLILTLLVTCITLTYFLYGKAKDTLGETIPAEPIAGAESLPSAAPSQVPAALPKSRPASVILDAPLIKQFPELPAGCEIVSMTMLLEFAGFKKTKMEMYEEMPKDTTPIKYGKNGKIESWGNPNVGYVGDATPKSKGFGIFHAGLFPLLQQYIPSAVDLTRKSFHDLEDQIASGVPVVVWTTIDFKLPQPHNWVTWDTQLGPVQTTFKEHAVLLVGYDEDSVYVNDPASGKAKLKLNKETFVEIWIAMGRQGLSYTK